MATYSDDGKKLTYAENAIDALRLVVERQKKELDDIMTPRDQFAMAALTSMLSAPQQVNDETPRIAAKWAYRFADALMEARAALWEGK